MEIIMQCVNSRKSIGRNPPPPPGNHPISGNTPLSIAKTYVVKTIIAVTGFVKDSSMCCRNSRIELAFPTARSAHNIIILPKFIFDGFWARQYFSVWCHYWNPITNSVELTSLDFVSVTWKVFVPAVSHFCFHTEL